MKTTLYNLLFLIVLSPALLFSNNVDPKSLNGKYTKEKKISKQFTVDANTLMKISNSYGNIDVSTWDQNTIKIEVFIKTNGNDEEKVIKKLNDINIKFNQSSSEVSARTEFPKSNNNSFWDLLFGESSNVNMEVNYVIKAPVNNNLDLNNDYGNIFIDKLNGNSKINCDYGRIDIGELNGDSNYLYFDYSRNSHFGTINKAIINSDYSEFTIENARSLDINADYSTSVIRKVELLQFNCDYGSLTVDKVRKLLGSADYLSTKIGQVHQSLDLNVDYGSVSIDKIMKSAGDITIASDYAGVKIGYATDYAFDFAVNTSYGSVSGMDNFDIRKQNKSSNEKNYSGYHLSSSNKSNIRINSSYANINFRQQ
ncbi:hypothetical protein L1I30_14140 [Gillisia sp. M10.2A]|uniref:Adhesin domain-containing protein n=1 Tax=Gillisia lutea TaxID=2909668 RepID=A0ABS9EIY0_9FLAO|nr:hypothetical protein [Gillisia lutea]MCF4102814.1 hypothetical protein [Gillisia lutea]